MIAVRTRQLGKAYKRYRRKAGRLLEWIGAGPQHELTWVLRDVTFDIERGESVGIVGANGAGKSTLLKIIAQTVRPTTGAFELEGRVAALLELGIGFHPDFTGRQNVLMSGNLLGIQTSELERLMGAIEAFAEIGDYIDRPVRTYSSGMQVRLAFSVATAVRPDILIVDEALSVGDAYFQHKSFDRIRQFRDQGTTLLFVSHSPGAVKTLCDRAILLEHGCVLRDDAPDATLEYYNAIIAAHRAEHAIRETETETGRKATRSGTSDATISEVELLKEGRSVRAVHSGDSVTVRISLSTQSALPDLTVGILIRDRLGNDVFGTNTFHLGMNRTAVTAGERLAIEFDFPSLDLGAGTYSLTAALHSHEVHISSNYDWWDRAVVFQVIQKSHPLTIGICSLRIAARWCEPAPRPIDAPPVIQSTS